MPASSSTMRMLCMPDAVDYRGGFDDNWKFNNEASAHGTVLFDANRSAMIFHDAVYDGEAEPGTALLSGEVGKKKSFLQLASHAMAGVGNSNFDGVAAGDQRGRN